jgi:outer membrane cobalamin receptor
VAVAALTLASVHAQSGQTPDVDAPRFNAEVVVTPERGETPRISVPASTIVIEGASLPALPVVHPSEVVPFIPGFSLARPQWHLGRPVVSARGFFGGGEAEYVLLLVDGIPLTDAESGLIDWSAVPSSSIRRTGCVDLWRLGGWRRDSDLYRQTGAWRHGDWERRLL